MSLCRNNIASNSSFSWWASWLNAHPEKRVFMPSVWCGFVDLGVNWRNIYYPGVEVVDSRRGMLYDAYARLRCYAHKARTVVRLIASGQLSRFLRKIADMSGR